MIQEIQELISGDWGWLILLGSGVVASFLSLVISVLWTDSKVKRKEKESLERLSRNVNLCRRKEGGLQ